MIYVLLGMHKSGTTLLSRILHESSINMGIFDSNQGYDQGNKYERLETHDLNIGILGCDYKEHSLNISKVIHDPGQVKPEMMEKMKAFVRSADSKFSKWGFKDPRTCLTYDVWKEVLPEHKIIAIFRHPSELWSHYSRQPKAWNIVRRISLGLKALHAWYVYNKELLRILKNTGQPYFLTHYSDLMARGEIMDKLSEFTETPLKDCRNNKLYRSKHHSGPVFNFMLRLHRLCYPKDGDIIDLYQELKMLNKYGHMTPSCPRLNKRPIFIAAFAYGGSNILLNLLRSHPQVCSPRGELNEVFKGKVDEPVWTRLAKNLRYFPSVIAEGGDFFRFNNWAERKPLSTFTQKRIDRILYDEKLRARDETQNLYKSESVPYTDDEIRNSRLLCKNLDGLIFVSRELAKMYPDAVFFGLVRNGFAVCEGHLRRGYDFETIARNYGRGVERMIEDSKLIPNYHIIRYEDLLEKPQETLEKIYRLAGLDIRELNGKVRLQVKAVTDKDGQRKNVIDKKWKEVVWLGINEFQKHFRSDLNENQIKRLTEEQKNTIIRLSGGSLRQFGYLPDPVLVER